MAPEHPHGIIKFIKRINEVYSLDKGSILIHCSAGVGRTGTLVALDSLFQQFNEEHQVAVFNTIVDLRHQRNFLVQSLVCIHCCKVYDKNLSYCFSETIHIYLQGINGAIFVW